MMDQVEKAIIDLMPIGYAYHKMMYTREKKPKDYLYIEANSKFCELLGLERDQVVGKKVSQLFKPIKDEVMKWIERYNGVITTGDTTTFEIYLKARNQYFKVFAFSPKAPYFVTYVMEITDEKKRLLELEHISNKFIEMDQKYRIVSDYFFDWEIWEQTDGKVVYVSSACERISGYPADDFVSNSAFFDQLIVSEDQGLWRTHRNTLAPEMQPRNLIIRIRHKEGQVIWIEHNCMPAFDNTGNCLGYRANNRDVTERILAEKTTKKSEERYKILFEHAVEGIMVVQDDYVKICNPKLCEITGYSREKLMSVPFVQFIYFEDIHPYLIHTQDISDENTVLNKSEYRVIYSNGEIRWLELTGIGIEWDGKPASLRFAVDVTQRKVTEDALRRSEEKYRFLTENTSDVIWIYNVTYDLFEYVSPSVNHLLGRSQREIYAEKLSSLVDGEMKESFLKAVQNRAEKFIESKEVDCSFIDEVQQRDCENTLVWTEISSRYRMNANGDVELIGVSRNVEERKQHEAKVLYLSYYDQLTGLNNRRYYEEKLEFLNQEAHLPVSLIVADVNGLKLTNDAFGHAAGDRLLIKISETLKKAIRKEDVLARIGGDEFVYVLPKTDAIEAKLFVEGLKRQLDKISTEDVIVSISLGFETKVDKDQNIEEVFSRAEDFMYKRKLTESRSMKSATFKKILQKMNTTYPELTRLSVQVSKLCKDFALKLKFSDAEIQDIGMLGLIYDVGKVGIDPEIVNNEGQLSINQYQEFKRHPEIGYQILRSTPEFAHLADFVLCHHEHYDGTGYPRHIQADLIPLQARILAIVTYFIELISDAKNKEPMSFKEAIDLLNQESGKLFDPVLVKCFVEMLM